MRPSTYKALLVIADISGFTQFMKSHKKAASHAMQVVVELLKAVISAAALPLKLAEVEGDAAFFYALCPDDGESRRHLPAIKKQVMSFFRSFHQTLRQLCAANLCACEACAGSVKNLRLKVIIHAGEVALEHIHGFDKLFGMDVILAHRLLKNSVRSQEYVLMTESAHHWLGDFQYMEPERQTEYCEDIGAVETVVYYPAAQSGGAAQAQPASRRPGPDQHSASAITPWLWDSNFSNTPGGRFDRAPHDDIMSTVMPLQNLRAIRRDRAEIRFQAIPLILAGKPLAPPYGTEREARPCCSNPA